MSDDDDDDDDDELEIGLAPNILSPKLGRVPRKTCMAIGSKTVRDSVAVSSDILCLIWPAFTGTTHNP